MNVLLDEDVAVPLLLPLRHLLQGHHVDHVKKIGWTGKKDKFVFADAVTHGYDVLLTKNVNQLSDPDECSALKKAGIHHVIYDQGDGLDGLGRAMGAILAAMPGIVKYLDGRQEQALIRVHGIAGQRFTETDPATIPYWPR
jgi:hypothetical protein